MKNIAIIGSNGTIGSAVLNHMIEIYPDARIHAFARNPRQYDRDTIQFHPIDYMCEDSLRIAAQKTAEKGPLDMVFVATGILHDEGVAPEKSLRDLSAHNFEHFFGVNTIVPALILKYFLPCLNRDARSLFAALSARLGSISDNGIGGWYAYRASKAALNMIIKTAAIEVARNNPHAVVVGLHPGTVDTPLSEPFQANVPEGQLFTPEFAAQKLMQVLDGLDQHDSGRCFAWDGQEIEP